MWKEEGLGYLVKMRDMLTKIIEEKQAKLAFLKARRPEELRKQIVELNGLNVALVQALVGLKRGDCYCEHGIDNPMFPDHTDSCKMATAVIEAHKG